jgi:hypothetical protein
MTKQKFLSVMAAVLIGCCFVPNMFATDVTMELTSVGSGANLGGVYTGPYIATINNGVTTISTPVVCDDYADESYLDEPWTAASTSLASLTGTKWSSATDYDEAAWLIEQLFNPANSAQSSDIQYAIWGIFDSQALANIQGSDYQNAEGWLNQAEISSNYTSIDAADFTIYTPVVPGQAQEFIVYTTPEPSFVAAVLADLVLFGFATAFLRRRRILQTV